MTSLCVISLNLEREISSNVIGFLVNLKYFVRFTDTATENTRDYRFLQSRAVHK